MNPAFFLVLTQIAPLNCTDRELSFEWTHLLVSADSFGFRNVLVLVKLALDSGMVFTSNHFNKR